MFKCVSYLSTEHNWVPTSYNQLVHNCLPYITSATRYCDDNHGEKYRVIRKRATKIEVEAGLEIIVMQELFSLIQWLVKSVGCHM